MLLVSAYFYLVISMIISLFMLVFALALYVFMGIGLSGLAKGEGNKFWYMAWIPVANIILLAMLVEEDVHVAIRGKFTWIMGASFILSFILFLKFSLAWLLVSAVMIYGFYFLARRYTENEVGYLAVSILTLGTAIPVLLFRIRKRTPLAVK